MAAFRFRTWREFWIGSGAGLLVGPSVFFAFGWQEVSELEGLDPNRGSRFSAVMTQKGKTLVFDASGGGRITCVIDRCGYLGSSIDVGVPRNYTMSGGWLLGVERDGTFVDVRSATLARKKRSLRFDAVLGALSLPCFVLAYVMRNSPMPKDPWAKTKVPNP